MVRGMTKQEAIDQLRAEGRELYEQALAFEEAAQRGDADALCSYARLLGKSNGLLRAALLVRALSPAKIAG